MSAESDAIRAELEELAVVAGSFAALAPAEYSPEWMVLESLRRRELQLRHELSLAEGTAELEIRLVGGAERESTVDAGFLAELLRSFQGAVRAALRAISSGELDGGHAAALPVSSSIRMAPAAAGSFVVLLEGPIRGGPITIDGELEIPPFDEAVARIMDVLDAAPTDAHNAQPAQRAAIAQAIADLGSHRAMSHIAQMTAAMASSGTSVSVVDRTPFRRLVREVRVGQLQAALIREVASQTRQTTSTIRLRGRLTGVRWRRSTFDLEVQVPDPAGGLVPIRVDLISGRVVADIREAVQAAFDRQVDAVIEKTVTTTEADLAERVRYRLVEIDLAPED